MPAPNLDILRDFESQFDTAMKLALAPFETAMQITPLHGIAEIKTPRIEYDFALGESVGPANQALVRGLVNGLPTAWRFTFTFRHVFDPARTSPQQAGGVRGQLRNRLAPTTQAFNATILPWLTIVSLDEISATRATFKDETEKHLCEWFSTYTGIFAINESAWPA